MPKLGHARLLFAGSNGMHNKGVVALPWSRPANVTKGRINEDRSNGKESIEISKRLADPK